MTITGGSPRQRNIRRRIYALASIDEFVPFAVLFTLWFDDNGVSVGHISAAFAMWALIALIIEVPTGALADRLDRRWVLAGAFGFRVAGIAVWIVWPTLAGLLAGAALWAVHDSAAGGAWEGLIHDLLVVGDDEHSYAVVMARAGQFTHIGLCVAALVTSPALAAGFSMASIGWFTCAMQFVTVALVLRLPDARWVVDQARAGSDDDDATIRAAWHTIRSDRSVMAPVFIGGLIAGLAIADEYVGLIARDRGASDALASIMFVPVWLGLILGGELAARAPAMSSERLAVLLTAGSAVGLAALMAEPAWSLALLAITFGAIQTTWVLADARLQARVPAHVRATVSSVREMGGGLVFAAALGLTAVLSSGDDPTPGLIVIAVALIATGVATRALPNAEPKT